MKRVIAVSMALLFSLPAAGRETPPTPAPGGDRSFTTVGAWLELQRSGAERGAPNPIPGQALERVYQRYLDSFAGAAAAPAGDPTQGH